MSQHRGAGMGAIALNSINAGNLLAAIAGVKLELSSVVPLLIACAAIASCAS